jgi:ATP-binding cassette subfamily B protein
VSAAKNADKIIVLEDGKKIQEGTHRELIQVKGYYKALYDSQYSEKEK